LDVSDVLVVSRAAFPAAEILKPPLPGVGASHELSITDFQITDRQVTDFQITNLDISLGYLGRAAAECSWKSAANSSRSFKGAVKTHKLQLKDNFL
jgi:hypothetical protein